MYLLRKGYVPMAGYVAERGGERPPPLHSADATFRSELRRVGDSAFLVSFLWVGYICKCMV